MNEKDFTAALEELSKFIIRPTEMIVPVRTQNLLARHGYDTQEKVRQFVEELIDAPS